MTILDDRPPGKQPDLPHFYARGVKVPNNYWKAMGTEHARPWEDSMQQKQMACYLPERLRKYSNQRKITFGPSTYTAEKQMSAVLPIKKKETCCTGASNGANVYLKQLFVPTVSVSCAWCLPGMPVSQIFICDTLDQAVAQTELEGEVYAHFLQGCGRHSWMAVRLNKGIDGLGQASRSFQLRLTTCLLFLNVRGAWLMRVCCS